MANNERPSKSRYIGWAPILVLRRPSSPWIASDAPPAEKRFAWPLRSTFSLAQLRGLKRNSLLRLLKMRGFGVIDAPYIQPQLGYPRPDTELDGALLMFPKPVAGAIPRATYLSIVKAIYFQHYVRWYGMYEGEFAQKYEGSVKKLYHRLEGKLKGTEVIVNGLKHFPEPVSSAVVPERSVPLKMILPIHSVMWGCASWWARHTWAWPFHVSTRTVAATIDLVSDRTERKASPTSMKGRATSTGSSVANIFRSEPYPGSRVIGALGATGSAGAGTCGD